MKTTLKDFIKENGFNQYGEPYGYKDLEGEDITQDLENFDIDLLNQFERRQYDHFIKSSDKVGVLHVLINNTEGDYSQLSDDLAEIAAKANPNWISEKKQYVEVTSNDTFQLDDKLSKEKGILSVNIETVKKARVYYNDKILKEVDVLDLVNKKNKSIKESKSNTPVKGSPEWHKVQIAKKTLKMSDIGANMMGGMTKEEAREILKKYNINIKESRVNESSQDEDQLSDYFNKLVGPKGPAETKEGELVRAMNKIIYRYFNDGDYFFKDYGIETCGSCAIFLMQQNIPGLQRALNNASNVEPESNKEYTDNDEYDKYLSEASKIICDYIDSKNGEYTPNNDDCLKYNREAMDKWDTYDPNDDMDDWEDDDDDIDESNKDNLYTEEEVKKITWEARKFYNDNKDLPFNKLRPLFYDWFTKNK